MVTIISSVEFQYQEVLDWMEVRKLTAYSISCGQSLIYNNFFPKHKVSGIAQSTCTIYDYHYSGQQPDTTQYRPFFLK